MTKRPPRKGGRRPGAGRKPLTGEALVGVVVGLPPATIARLDALGGNRSAAIRQAVERWLQEVGG